MQCFHQILFSSNDELADLDEIRLSVLFDMLKQQNKNSDIESRHNCIRKILDLIDQWPFENL